MSAINDSGYLAGSLLQVIAADAIVQMAKAGVTRNLVTVRSAPKADTIAWTVYNDGTNTVTSGDVANTAEGTVIPSTKLNSTKKTATLDMYSVMIPVYDEAILSSSDDPGSQVGELIGNAVAAKIDALLNANFDNFSNSVGTSTVGLKVDNLLSALAVLELYKGGELSGVFHAAQLWGTYGLFSDILTSSQFGGSPPIQGRGLESGFVDKVVGVNIYNSNEITETSNARKGAIFGREAIGWGFAGPEIRLEVQREGDYLRNNYIASGFWGTAELRDAAGVEVHTKTS